MNFNIPGKGIYNETGLKQRIEFLNSQNIATDFLKNNSIPADSLGSNIENFIGALTIPLGLIGPLKLSEENEPIFSAIATTEGALVASTNRGVKALGLAGGVNTIVESQNMSRCPIFVFENLSQCHNFCGWVKDNIDDVKKEVTKYSQHTRLKSIEPTILGKDTHLMFNYSTGDAAGQNTTTTCTWHTCTWIIKKFNEESSYKIQKFYIESNGSSDKKISTKSVINGRGVKVSADIFLPENIICDVLKSTSDEMIDYLRRTVPITFYNGISSHNGNVANLIAGLFSSCGQDIASVHESANGFLNFEKVDNGLYCSIKLPNLVIGTVGGGTHLAMQKSILKMMNCYGPNRVERFAKIIAGYCLALEISIIAAMASGQFAMAHERLGRNKPINFVDKKQFKQSYIKDSIPEFNYLELIEFNPDSNGILTQLTSLETRKHLGFSKWKGTKSNKTHHIYIKSKPSNREVINSLYRTIGAFDPRLASQFSQFQHQSEFNRSTSREIEVLETLQSHDFPFMPKVFKLIKDEERESYHIFQEYIDKNDTKIFNSENDSNQWGKNDLFSAFRAVHQAQKTLTKNKSKISSLHYGDFTETLNFSKNMLTALRSEKLKDEKIYEIIDGSIKYLESHPSNNYLKLITHNDFNPRNVVIDKNDKVLIYDWELCSENLPQKDSIEFLCFCKDSSQLSENTTEQLLQFHFSLVQKDYPQITQSDWKQMNKMALAQFISQRFSHYLVGSRLTEYKFLPKLILNTQNIYKELFS